jgi:hypothetical protein
MEGYWVVEDDGEERQLRRAVGEIIAKRSGIWRSDAIGALILGVIGVVLTGVAAEKGGAIGWILGLLGILTLVFGVWTLMSSPSRGKRLEELMQGNFEAVVTVEVKELVSATRGGLVGVGQDLGSALQGHKVHKVMILTDSKGRNHQIDSRSGETDLVTEYLLHIRPDIEVVESELIY